jgi:hypothetical protein
MKIVTKNIGELTLDPKNARKHDGINIDSIAASLDKFGQQKPIVVNKAGVILAGNGTYQAAVKLGWTEITVAQVPDNWDAKTQAAYAIADNRTAELATWDNPILLEALTDLPDDLLAATGFNSDSIAAIMKVWGETPNLDDLYDSIGEPTAEDGMTRVSFMVPVDVAERWNYAVKSAGSGSPLENVCTAVQAAYDSICGDE